MNATGEADERHFSGVITRMVVTYVADAHGPEVLSRILQQACLDDAEVGGEADLLDDTAWVSYRRLRALLEATAELLGGSDVLREAVLASRLDSDSHADMTQMLQDFGSPGNLLRTVLGSETDSGAFGISTIMLSSGAEQAPGEWVLRQRFEAGFEPFREFCAFIGGMHALLPTLFGLPPGSVNEEQCACDGAPECVFRLRWEATADLSHQKSYFETRSRVLEARLAMLQRTVVDLISAPDPSEGLQRVLETAARAVHAPAYILAIHEAIPVTPHIHFMGIDEREALAIGATLPRHLGVDTPGMVVVEVASTRSTYGYLAAMQPGSRRFLPQEREFVFSCAGLAAAALDSMTALEEARRQTMTARTLLDLSSSLTQMLSKEEMAYNLVRAVPSVIDCDWSIVLINDPDLDEVRVAAAHGLSEETSERLGAVVLPTSIVSDLGGGVAFHGEAELSNSEALYGITFGARRPVAAASAPMVANGELIGALLVLVTDRPERLRESEGLTEALRGLSGQAAVAIRNAGLVDQVRHQALHDGLTGLPNRTLVIDRMEQALARSIREGVAVATLFMDLDGFKEINDSLGHAAGDRLLVALADRLRLTLRDSDTVGRLGGDEFVIVAEGDSLADGPHAIAERILDVMRVPFELEGFTGTSVSVTASVGMAIGPRQSAGELLRDADIALYHAKEQGKDRYVLFEPAMSTRRRARLDYESDIGGALAAQQFFLVYQPFFDFQQGAVIGAEALIRWRHPTHGVVDARHFVPLLEESGAICQVGQWVLEEAARQGHQWHQLGFRIDVSVNVSRGQLLSGHLADDVVHALSSSGLDPSTFILEIAESIISRDAPSIIAEIRGLKELGVKVAIDDFGTAYSSLAYLSQFPIDGVKIDRSFISSIDETVGSGSLIHVLLELGRSLGLTTMAEGIENSAQMSRLHEEGCDKGQGFLLARPLSPQALRELLEASPGESRSD
jgi:diguanylate cyclase (GGDEF)-like protein